MLKNLSLAHQSASSSQKSALLAIAALFVAPYKRTTPPSRQSVSEAKKALIVQYLKASSQSSCLQTSDGSPIYHLQCTKKAIYEKMVAEHPEYKVALSTFYKYCPKNFKPLVKKTNMYSVCI
ncbi:hypothetical protein H4219_001034 [Mycoemilia scoparia]|uniref:Uncharacterized protein n=1 Tax=Mycoemilia scoparia TaxID=417184 RepID=A0A9W8A4A4_9FUNG|nr:hypothetical protein H4219_001034 [Mycoemilia scoparia]